MEENKLRKSKSITVKNITTSKPIRKVKSLLYDLLEEKEEDLREEDEFQNISFSLSNCDDMNDLLDNFSNKSDEKVEIEYQSTTNEECLEIIEDYIKESTKQILNSKKGFDEDAKKMSNEFYSNLVKNINLQKDLKKNIKPHYLDNNNNTNYMTKSESIYSDEQTKFKNDLIGRTLENKEKENDGFGKVFSLKSKNSLSLISRGKNSSQFIAEEDEDDKIIQIKKKRRAKINENK